MVIKSYICSTDRHGKPCRQNLLCCVNNSVVGSITLARSLSDTQRQLINNVTAGPTALRAGKPAVDFNQLPTIPSCLVDQLSYQLIPSGIRNRASHIWFFTIYNSASCGRKRLQTMFNGSAHLARNSLLSRHLKADLVNSALPPLRFFFEPRILSSLFVKTYLEAAIPPALLATGGIAEIR